MMLPYSIEINDNIGLAAVHRFSQGCPKGLELKSCSSYVLYRNILSLIVVSVLVSSKLHGQVILHAHGFLSYFSWNNPVVTDSPQIKRLWPNLIKFVNFTHAALNLSNQNIARDCWIYMTPGLLEYIGLTVNFSAALPLSQGSTDILLGPEFPSREILLFYLDIPGFVSPDTLP